MAEVDEVAVFCVLVSDEGCGVWVDGRRGFGELKGPNWESGWNRSGWLMSRF
jgi:hypothetical protein